MLGSTRDYSTMRKRGFLVAVAGLATTSLIAAAPVMATDPTPANPQNSVITVNLEPSISLALYAAGDTSSEITDLEFELDPVGNLVAKGIIARVSTNSPRYKLTLEMSGATTDLVQAGATRQIVGTVTDNVTAATMRQNSWGYSIDATNFSKVPANGSPATIKNGTKTTTAVDTSAYEDTTVTFGVKVDGAIQSGTYTGSVVLTAVSLDDNGDEN